MVLNENSKTQNSEYTLIPSIEIYVILRNTYYPSQQKIKQNHIIIEKKFS